MSSFLSRRSGSADSAGGMASFTWGRWGELYPALAEFLTAAKWPDGSTRVPGTLTMFVDAGAWKACLSDKDQGLIAFTSASDPEALLETVERGLVSNALDWRGARGPGRNKR